MKKIIIIDHEPLTLRRNSIFYIYEMTTLGYQIFHWDCSQFTSNKKVETDLIKSNYSVIIHDFNCFKNILEKEDCDNIIFIVEVANEWRNRRIYKLLSDKHCFCVRQNMYATVALGRPSFFERLSGITYRKVYNKFYYLLYKLYLRHYHIHINAIISSGNNKMINYHINHPDWESYKKSINQKCPVGYDYAVFLDEFFPLHPDLYNLNKSYHPSDSSHYYQLLNNLFDKLEHDFHVKVVIAAHPKSIYNKSEFGNREIIKYNTAVLVHNAKFVIAHHSAALSYVIMSNKQLLLISTDDYEKTYKNVMSVYSKHLGLPYTNLDHDCYAEPSLIDDSIRDDYIYSFLTTQETKDKSNVSLLDAIYRNMM